MVIRQIHLVPKLKPFPVTPEFQVCLTNIGVCVNHSGYLVKVLARVL